MKNHTKRCIEYTDGKKSLRPLSKFESRWKFWLKTLINCIDLFHRINMFFIELTLLRGYFVCLPAPVRSNIENGQILWKKSFRPTDIICNGHHFSRQIWILIHRNYKLGPQCEDTRCYPIVKSCFFPRNRLKNEKWPKMTSKLQELIWIIPMIACMDDIWPKSHFFLKIFPK